MPRPKKPKLDQPRQSDQSAAKPAWRARRIALHLALAGLLGGGCVVGFVYMRDYVDATAAEAAAPPQVVFKNRPAWMTDLVAGQLAASFRPAQPRSVFDHDVLVQTNQRLKANPWIAKVTEVRRVYGAGPGDTIEVDCEFRAPIGLVRSGPDYWFVDSHAVKLPESFPEADLRKVVFAADGRANIRVIEGVRRPPPALAGQVWAGEDLAAGLDLVTRLYGQPFADDIVRVNVHNYGGRVDPAEAQIVLVTKYDSQIRWGRAWQATDGFIEVRPERKMASLRRIVEEFGRVDARQRWIDIRFDRITYPSPGAAGIDPAAAQTAGAQEAGR